MRFFQSSSTNNPVHTIGGQAKLGVACGLISKASKSIHLLLVWPLTFVPSLVLAQNNALFSDLKAYARYSGGAWIQAKQAQWKSIFDIPGSRHALNLI